MIDFGTAQLCKDGCSVAEGISGTPGMCLLARLLLLFGAPFALACSLHVFRPTLHKHMCVAGKLLDFDHAIDSGFPPLFGLLLRCVPSVPQCSWPPR